MAEASVGMIRVKYEWKGKVIHSIFDGSDSIDVITKRLTKMGATNITFIEEPKKKKKE